MEEQRAQTKQAADTEIHRFFSILGSPGGGKIDEFSKKSLLKCMRFFACEKNLKKRTEKLRNARLGGMRGVCGEVRRGA